MIAKAHRLTTKAEFSAVYNSGKVLSNNHFRLNFDFHSSDGKAKVAVVASKKVGKATVRNTLRRRAKAVFRTHPLFAHTNFRCIITCKPGVERLAFAELQRELTDLLDRVRY